MGCLIVTVMSRISRERELLAAEQRGVLRLKLEPGQRARTARRWTGMPVWDGALVLPVARIKSTFLVFSLLERIKL